VQRRTGERVDVSSRCAVRAVTSVGRWRRRYVVSRFDPLLRREF